MRAVLLVRLVALPLLACAACHTRFETRAASDYDGYPHRVIVNGFGGPSDFRAPLTRNIEACGITVIDAPVVQDGATVSRVYPTEADALLTYRTVGVVWLLRNGFSNTRTEAVGDVIEAEFEELPGGQIVWRGRFQIERKTPFASPANTSRDLVRRLADDGILKACSGK